MNVFIHVGHSSGGPFIDTLSTILGQRIVRDKVSFAGKTDLGILQELLDVNEVKIHHEEHYMEIRDKLFELLPKDMEEGKLIML